MKIRITDCRLRRKNKWSINREILINHDYLNKSIKLPIEIIIYKPKRETNWGDHYILEPRIFKSRIRHIIRINQNLSAYHANITLWHELRHCIQSEKFTNHKDFHRVYKLAGGNYNTGFDYYNNPFEVEANNFSEQFAPRYKVVT